MYTQDWIMVLSACILCAISFALLYIDMRKHNENYKLDKVTIIYSIIMSVLVVAIAVYIQLTYREQSLLFNLKRVCLLAILWPVALIDFKTYRIPNIFILYGILCRVLILIMELILGISNLDVIVISEVVAAVALFVASMLCTLCIKDSVGAGDIKLFAIMGLMLGLDGIWSSIFTSLIVSFFVAVYLLMSKKKNRKDSIPFGPAIAIGTFISIYFTGM